MATAPELLDAAPDDRDPPDDARRTSPSVVAIERASYQFPWSEGIFRDCLRVGYICRVVDARATSVIGYGVMSVGAGEAHILNLCVDASLPLPRHRPAPARLSARARRRRRA